jgi:hypothetical protein
MQSFDLHWQLVKQFYTHIDHAFLIQSSFSIMCVEVMSLPCIMIMYLTIMFHIPYLLLLVSTARCDVTEVYSFKAIGIYYSVPMNIILV